MNYRPYLVPSVVLIVIAVLIGAVSLSNFGQTDTSNKQKKVEDFTLQDVNTLSEFQMINFTGSPVILNFMATWCVTCPYSYPELQEVGQNYPQIEIFTISIDPDFDTPIKLLDYAGEHSISWHLARDIYGVGISVFQVVVIPTIVLLDKDFNIVEQQDGTVSFETMEKWISSISR